MPQVARPTLFLLAVGHQDPSHEEVIEDHDAYLIAKTEPGIASQLAAETG